MEAYTGIKFRCTRTGTTFAGDGRLAELNAWAFILAELGLTPRHPTGAYGNQSYRFGPGSLIITKSGMVPTRELLPDNYVCIEGYDPTGSTFSVMGASEPSSESILHYRLYQEFPDAGAVLHGHSLLFEYYSKELDIPVTPAFQPYGTPELAESAVSLLQTTRGGCIQLKGHGFVAMATDIQTAGIQVLAIYEKLISLLRSGGVRLP